MDTLLETNAAVDQLRQGAETVRQAFDGKPDSPRPEWRRGVCPKCGAPVVSNCYYVGGKGYLVCWECWESLGESPSCDYRKVL